MIDLANMKATFTKQEWQQVVALFPEARIRKTGKGHSYFFWHNLRLEYVPYFGEIWIKNSLHKFYNAEVRDIPIGKHNYNEFTLDNLEESIMYLCEIIQRKPKDLKLFGKLEFGININVLPFNPMEIINSYISLNTTRIVPFYVDQPRNGKPFGKSASLTNYRVKFYDKSKQAEIQEKGILRFEICLDGVKTIRQLLNKAEVTLADLMNQNTFKIMSDKLLSTFSKISKLPIRQDQIPNEVLLGLYGYCEPTLIEHFKRTSSAWSFQEQRKECKRILSEYNKSPSSIHNWVNTKLSNNLFKLTN